jgi:O-antigen/teichoic acid export membrane protein
MLKKNLNQRKAGAFLSYIQIVLTTVIQVIYTPFLIRMLGQSEYGLYSLIASIIGYLTILDLGFGNAIIVYTAKYKATSNIEIILITG